MLGEFDVQLDAGQAGAHVHEPVREYSESGSYFEQSVGVGDAGVADYAVGHAVIYQKVLAFALLGHYAR